jgi:hypothetical protein
LFALFVASSTLGMDVNDVDVDVKVGVIGDLGGIGLKRL